MRAAPVGMAAEDEARRAVFSSSLQQAQELADASSDAGYATKPLLQFYALSQGLRALNAAVEETDRWRIRGHGASVETGDKLMATKTTPKPSAKSDSMDSLTAAQGGSELQSLPMTEAMSFGAIWLANARIPDLPDDLRVVARARCACMSLRCSRCTKWP